jgi:hypothetical protein
MGQPQETFASATPRDSWAPIFPGREHYSGPLPEPNGTYPGPSGLGPTTVADPRWTYAPGQGWGGRAYFPTQSLPTQTYHWGSPAPTHQAPPPPLPAIPRQTWSSEPSLGETRPESPDYAPSLRSLDRLQSLASRAADRIGGGSASREMVGEGERARDQMWHCENDTSEMDSSYRGKEAERALNSIERDLRSLGSGSHESAGSALAEIRSELRQLQDSPLARKVSLEGLSDRVRQAERDSQSSDGSLGAASSSVQRAKDALERAREPVSAVAGDEQQDVSAQAREARHRLDALLEHLRQIESSGEKGSSSSSELASTLRDIARTADDLSREARYS